MAQEQGQKELNRAALILSWNERIMSTLGLWPNTRNNIKFSINFGYFSFLMILEYMDLVVFINDLEHVIMNLTENMAFSQIFVRMIMLWIYNDEIGDVINETIKDFDHRRYKTIEERQLFITYNDKSKLFVKLLITFVALTASSYYLTPILVSLGNGKEIFIFVSNLFFSKRNKKKKEINETKGEWKWKVRRRHKIYSNDVFAIILSQGHFIGQSS